MPGCSRGAGRRWSSRATGNSVCRQSPGGWLVTFEPADRFTGMRRVVMAVALLLTACGQAPVAHSTSTSLTTTPSPTTPPSPTPPPPPPPPPPPHPSPAPTPPLHPPPP